MSFILTKKDTGLICRFHNVSGYWHLHNFVHFPSGSFMFHCSHLQRARGSVLYTDNARMSAHSSTLCHNERYKENPQNLALECADIRALPVNKTRGVSLSVCKFSDWLAILGHQLGHLLGTDFQALTSSHTLVFSYSRTLVFSCSRGLVISLSRYLVISLSRVLAISLSRVLVISPRVLVISPRILVISLAR